jgi:small conductance mechanosensitive channel
MISRLLSLCGHLLVDLIPIVVFALASYAVLALVDPRQETRLVAVALINASILSRTLVAVSAFFFAPQYPPLRLWQLGDETAHYLHQWIKRLSVIAIYGFFSLQASLLLGLHAGGYQLLLKLLGLIILALFLVLVAQNREQVGQAIAAEPAAHSDEPSQLSSLRKGLARVWHLITGLYLIAIYGIWVLQVKDGAQFVLQATLISLLVIGITRLLMRGADHLFERGLRLSQDLQTQFPGLEKRLNRYFPSLRKLLKSAITVFATLLVINVWGLNALAWFSDGAGKVLLVAALNILLIIMIALFLWELASGGVEHYLAQTDAQGKMQVRSPRIRTLLTVARNALLVVLSVVATLMVLSELGINIAPLLAGAGVVGLAIGFGAQRLVQDVINGAFILFQDLMAVGDVVKLGDKAGVVEALSIRTVQLRDLAGTVHTIPFSAIEGVSNLTRDFSYHVFDLGIAYREDVDAVIGLIKQIGEELRADNEIGPLILEPLEVFGLDAFGDSAIVIKGRIKTQPIKQWQVARAFNRLVKQRFDAQGIEIPFPHTTVYFGQDKQGMAPPAFVQMETMLRDSIGRQTAIDRSDMT